MKFLLSLLHLGEYGEFLTIFKYSFALGLAFFIHFGFCTASRTTDAIPFGFDGYFFKPAMLFTDKLIYRHDGLPG